MRKQSVADNVSNSVIVMVENKIYDNALECEHPVEMSPELQLYFIDQFSSALFTDSSD